MTFFSKFYIMKGKNSKTKNRRIIADNSGKIKQIRHLMTWLVTLK